MTRPHADKAFMQLMKRHAKHVSCANEQGSEKQIPNDAHGGGKPQKPMLYACLKLQPQWGLGWPDGETKVKCGFGNNRVCPSKHSFDCARIRIGKAGNEG